MTGLRDFKQYYKGLYPWRIPKFLWRELKYAWQRAWKGYDDGALWSFSDAFRNWAIPVLKETIIHLRGSNTDWIVNGKTFSAQEIGSMLENFVDNLQKTDIDFLVMQSYDGDVDHLDWAEMDRVRKQSQIKTFEFLTQWFNYL